MQLPPRARLRDLNHLTRNQVVELYQRAKVLIDSYVTGMERPIFESAVFDVVPLVAVQGNARHGSDFPLPPAWGWQVGAVLCWVQGGVYCDLWTLQPLPLSPDTPACMYEQGSRLASGPPHPPPFTLSAPLWRPPPSTPFSPPGP